MVPISTMIGSWVFVGCFLAGAGGAWFMARYALRLGLIDLPNSRSSHTTPTPRGGGVGIMVAFALGAFFLRVPFGVWSPAAFLAVLSFFDDRLDLSPKVRLGFQFASALVVITTVGVDGGNFFLSFFLMAFWSFFIVGTANFYNFMDGINGIAGITGVVGFLLISLFIYLSDISSVPVLLPIGLALACLGFLPFNFPKAKVFMGDVGSVLLGFVFAVLVFWLSKGFADFLCLITFMFPFYADALSTLYIRWRDGEKLSHAHRRHLYQLLVNESGFPHWQVSLGYGAAQLFFGLLMLQVFRVGPHWQIGLFIFYLFVFLVICFRIRKKIKNIFSSSRNG